MMIKRFLSLAASALAISLAHAAPVTITNYSFEEGTGLPDSAGGWNNNNPEGWMVDETGGQIGMQIENPAPAGVDGVSFAFVQGDETSLIQDITTGTGSSAAVGDVFTLTVAAFNQNASPSFDFDITNFSGESLIGGPITTNVAGEWTDYQVVATVDTASPEVRIVLNANGPQIRFDNVRLDFESALGGLLEITDITRVPSETPGMVNVTITWRSQPGISYSIESSGATLDNFEEIDDIESNSETTSYTETISADVAARFYRVLQM